MTFPPVHPRSALVTGCSSGIGLATARGLRARGWTVYPTARRDDDLARLRADGFEPIRLDLADSSSVLAAAAEALRLGNGALGAVVNNAGFGQPGALEDLSREALRRQFEVNVFGLQELTNRLLPAFRRQGGGRVVNVSSVLGRLSLPFMGAYSASKFALEALSDALRVELTGTGIAVAIVEPGPIATAFHENASRAGQTHLAGVDSRFAEDYRLQLAARGERRTLSDRFRLGPEAVAHAIAHALESSRPRARYPVTVVAHWGALMARVAPVALMDAVMRRRARQRRSDYAADAAR